MIDFFISYTSADKKWAEWIGYVLEEERHSVILQAWDFRPGSNFILEMQESARKAAQTIMVLSPDYLKSQFANPEWAAAFAKDPQGLMRKVIPVVVRECHPDGLLGQIIHINLVGLDQAAARAELIVGVRKERAKPATRPTFPGSAPEPKSGFPGSANAPLRSSPAPYVPKVRRAASELEKRKCLKDTFAVIMDHFKRGVAALGEDPHVHGELATETTPPELSAELFVDGGSKGACRIWLGDGLGETAICYVEGRKLSFRGNSYNEIISVIDDGGELALSAMMDMGIRFGGSKIPFDTKRMTPDQTAEYLWRRFAAHLEY
jgi:hypothetical protein